MPTTYPGMDIMAWDARLSRLWRRSNLRFCGFYLAHWRGDEGTTWSTRLWELRDTGWTILPLWVPFKATQIDGVPANPSEGKPTATPGGAFGTADGGRDGDAAVALARRARLEAGATIYLDVEGHLSGGQGAWANPATGTADYILAWLRAVSAAGYRTGFYCYRAELHPHSLLDPRVTAFRPVFYAVSVPKPHRARWNNTTFHLAPYPLPSWGVGADERWQYPDHVIAVQYAQVPDPALTWPDANGRPMDHKEPNSHRSVDWDEAKVFDPAHPKAARALAAAQHHSAPDRVRLFAATTDQLLTAVRDKAGKTSPLGQTPVLPRDTVPPPPAGEDGFDATSIAASSGDARSRHVFLLGADGRVRIRWVTPRQSYPPHPQPVNPARLPARKGSPLAAASRTPAALDLVYVDREHRLVRQFSTAGPAVDWTNNVQTVLPPARAGGRDALLVAGGSNLAMLPAPTDAVHTADRLDVFHVGHDYTTPPWNDPRAWQVVHTRWSFPRGRPAAPVTALVPGLDGVAAASGVAATRTADRALHLVVQDRARTRLRHAVLKRAGPDWETVQGPTGELPPLHRPERGDPQPAWWMNLHLLAAARRVLLVGTLATGHLAWATYDGASWSGITARPAGFTPGRPLCLARRGTRLVDVFGWDEDGQLLQRTLTLLDQGGAALAPVPG